MVMEALALPSLTLVAVMVYTPADEGAVKVTGLPDWLDCGLNDPSPGLTLHVTPALALVDAVRSRTPPVTTAGRFGDIDTVIDPDVTIVIVAEAI